MQSVLKSLKTSTKFSDRQSGMKVYLFRPKANPVGKLINVGTAATNRSETSGHDIFARNELKKNG